MRSYDSPEYFTAFYYFICSTPTLYGASSSTKTTKHISQQMEISSNYIGIIFFKKLVSNQNDI